MEDTRHAMGPGGQLNLRSSLEHEALEKAEGAMAILEQLQSIISKVESLATVVPFDFRQELTVIAQQAQALYNVVNQEDCPIDLSESFAKLPKSKIMRLGINRQVIEMKAKGRTYREIAEEFNVSEALVATFCRVYDRAVPSQQIAIRQWSIMDTASRMEELGALIYNQMARLGNDPSNQNRYVESQIKLIKMAEDFMKGWETKEKIAQVQVTVQEIFVDELKNYPELQQSVMKRFQTLGIKGALKGS